MNIQRRKFSITDLHPEVRGAFSALSEDLALAYQTNRTEFLLEPFEGLRSPDRQAHLLTEGTTKAGPWKSAHQYGLAVDFVKLSASDIHPMSSVALHSAFEGTGVGERASKLRRREPEPVSNVLRTLELELQVRVHDKRPKGGA